MIIYLIGSVIAMGIQLAYAEDEGVLVVATALILAGLLSWLYVIAYIVQSIRR